MASLSRHSDTISARFFIGQGSKGKGKSKEGGMTQKEQKEVIQAFREARFNTLVATCIGEEGLDIPEVSRQLNC